MLRACVLFLNSWSLLSGNSISRYPSNVPPPFPPSHILLAVFFFLHARTLYYIMDIYMFYLVNHFNSSLDWVMEEEMYTQSLKNHSFHMLFFSAVEERIAERLRDISWSFEKVSVWFFSRMFWWFYILPHITLEYLVHMLSRFFLKILRNHHYLCVWPEGNIGVC